MKTNYKQSQAAPHAKPIFTVSRNDSTLYVLPAYLAGAVMIRLQHIADGDKVKKLCCKVKNDRLMAMEQDVPQGNVTLTAVDIISPEKCAEKGWSTRQKSGTSICCALWRTISAICRFRH